MDLHVFPILYPLPPPSPSHPSGSSQCTSPEHSSHASNLDKNEAKIRNKPEKDTSSSLLQSLKTAFYLAAVPISFTVSVHAMDSVIL